MKTQRGSILIYGLIALAVVALAGGAVITYKNAITRAEKAEAALATCTASYATVLKQIDNQNRALETLADERDAAQGRAKAALAAAAKASARLKPERERLATLEQTFKAAGACPAGEAVSEVRKGLKP